MKQVAIGAWLFGVATLSSGCGSGDATPASSSGGAAGSPATAVGGQAGNPSAAGGSPGSGPSGGAGAASTLTGGAGAAIAQGGGGPSGALPEGDTGLASKHPGDAGIADDPNVLFADDFEKYPATSQGPDINKVWDAVYQNQYVGIATDAANVHGGKQALQFTLPQGPDELSDGTDKLLTEQQDTLFLRYYGKFESPYDVVGSSHNGSSISAHYFNGNMATPGVPADGKNKFLVNLENWRADELTASPGQLNVYVYHPEQRSPYGDHFYPTGLVNPNTSIPFDFGPDFVKRPDIIPDLDRWYCYEYMLKANEPGKRDGRIAIWLDGKLVADFGNLRFRDVASLTIDRFGLSFHIKSNPKGQTRKWYDDVVAAKQYIGPVAK